jgi:hypothetical protein
MKLNVRPSMFSHTDYGRMMSKHFKLFTVKIITQIYSSLEYLKSLDFEKKNCMIIAKSRPMAKCGLVLLSKIPQIL